MEEEGYTLKIGDKSLSVTMDMITLTIDGTEYRGCVVPARIGKDRVEQYMSACMNLLSYPLPIRVHDTSMAGMIDALHSLDPVYRDCANWRMNMTPHRILAPDSCLGLPVVHDPRLNDEVYLEWTISQ